MIQPEAICTLRMTSGNEATLYLYANSAAIAIKREWERAPSAEDTEESTEAITRALDSLGVPVGNLIQKTVPDPAIADELVVKHMKGNLQ